MRTIKCEKCGKENIPVDTLENIAFTCKEKECNIKQSLSGILETPKTIEYSGPDFGNKIILG